MAQVENYKFILLSPDERAINIYRPLNRRSITGPTWADFYNRSPVERAIHINRPLNGRYILIALSSDDRSIDLQFSDLGIYFCKY